MTIEMLPGDLSSAELLAKMIGRRPQTKVENGRGLIRVNEATGTPYLQAPQGVTINSMLREDEWAEVDRAVIEAARYPLRAVQDLRSRGLTVRLGGLGTLMSHWYTRSEMTAASVSMSGQGGGLRDLPDMDQNGVPVPVVWKDFSIDVRTLEASRRMGDGLDVTAALEATRVVAETLESMVVNGASVKLNGVALYGYTTHPDRNTDTAANYGGGDWGTIANVLPTVAGMINAANGDNHYGPFQLYVSQTQYNQAALSYYTDGSGQTALDRISKLPAIAGVSLLPASTLADGVVLLVQMTRETVEWAEALDIQVREWTSGDGMASHYKVLAVAAPRVKSRYDGKSGIVHATGA